jgi:hypothetical protein
MRPINYGSTVTFNSFIKYGSGVPGLCADNVAVGALSARDIIVQQILADLGRLAAPRVAAYQNHRVRVDLLQDGRLQKEG